LPVDVRISTARWRACLALISIVLAVALGGCLSTSDPSPPGPNATTTSAATASPARTLSGPPSVPPGAGTVDTDWGTAWDALPPGFPQYPGSTPTEIRHEPASAILDVPADVPRVTTWLQAALEHAGFSTLSLSGPSEDGSMEIETVGPDTRCRVRTTIAPLGTSTIVTVLYGRFCPPT
jgi:hypothetical protein